MGNLRGTLSAVILAVLCTCYVDVATGQRTDPNEVNALKAIKGSLIDPTNKLKNWNSGDPCTSRWRGIVCGKIPNDSYLHVTEIQLFKMNLSGTLAPEVGLLSHQSGDISKIIDNRMSSCPPECATKFLSLAVKCCRDETEERPFMADIVRELEAILGMLPEGEDLLSETTEPGSGALTKSMSSSTTTGAFYMSSHTSSSDHTNSGIPSGTVAPR